MRSGSSACRVARKPSGGSPASGLKQSVAPVWQTGPSGSARTSNASASQSLVTPVASRKFPDVSPFVHNLPRLRLKNVTRRLASVRRSASGFM